MSAAVLFLDVDGVLAMQRCAMEEYEEGDESLYFVNQLCPFITTHITPLEKSRVAMLKWVIDQIPQLKIVITSTWRIDISMRTFLVCALESAGIQTSEVVLGDTPITHSCRGSEIREWLNMHPIYWDNFVIVDDEHMSSFVAYGLADRCVQTLMHGEASLQGLSYEAAERIVCLFRTPHEGSLPLPPVAAAAPSPGPKLVFLCGIPGIGKDSLCDYVCQHFPVEFQWFQCFSQDQFAAAYGPQKGLACQQAVESALADGYSVILKRNNHTIQDRRAYVEMAW
jgi:hypothetical protein